MPGKNFPNISVILSITSLIYIMTATAGLIYNVLYYKEFNIDISNYIDLEESLLLFMPKIKGIGIFFLYFGIISFMSFQLITRKIKPKTTISYILSLIIPAGALVIIWEIVLWIYANDFVRYRTLFFIVPLFVPFIFTVIYYRVLKWIKIQLTVQGHLFVYILFMFIYGTIALSYLNVKTVSTFKKISCAHIFYKDDSPPVLATSVNKYIGRSKKYIFLYDSILKQATILPADNVRSIVLEK